MTVYYRRCRDIASGYAARLSAPAFVGFMCISDTAYFHHNEQKPPFGSPAHFSVCILNAPLYCVSGISVGFIGNLQKFQSALNLRKPFLGVFCETVHRSLHAAFPVRLGNQDSVAELHDAVVAGAKPIVVALDADAVVGEVNQVLFHGKSSVFLFFRRVFPLGVTVYYRPVRRIASGYTTRSSARNTGQNVRQSSSSASCRINSHGIVEKFRVVLQRFPTVILINLDLVFDHLFGSLQRKAGFFRIVHITIDLRNKLHHHIVHVLLPPGAFHAATPAPLWGCVGLSGLSVLPCQAGRLLPAFS
uniref:Uncharacterized protein n=1 Tax=Siphoviridae sp. ctLmu1 TaxID=2826253 RepID=A0A8S5NH36_9CAUD|nr:MAG TPA: hypothetical protein [Siphoviridae sp. ctLmu1]DAJ29710.1 MAG TPA: hypothetical protein [Caudoviricetes sp.]